jgi:ribonuclease P protein component
VAGEKTNLRFPTSSRLHGEPAFAAVYAARLKKHAGPLTIFALANELGYPRLGLSVSRRVGTAVRRNRIKRLLREALRLGQHGWPAPYDIVVVVRPHEPQTLADYQRLLGEAVRAVNLEWLRRQR